MYVCMYVCVYVSLFTPVRFAAGSPVVWFAANPTGLHSRLGVKRGEIFIYMYECMYERIA